jgi:hypothetical protein
MPVKTVFRGRAMVERYPGEVAVSPNVMATERVPDAVER